MSPSGQLSLYAQAAVPRRSAQSWSSFETCENSPCGERRAPPATTTAERFFCAWDDPVAGATDVMPGQTVRLAR